MKNYTFFLKYFHTKKWGAMMYEMCSLTTFLHSSNNSCTIYSINSKESEREGSVFGCMMWCEWWLKPHFYSICLMMNTIICLILPLFECCFWAYFSTVFGLIWVLFLGLFERYFWAYLSTVFELIWALFWAYLSAV